MQLANINFELHLLQKPYVNYLNEIPGPALYNVSTESHCYTCRMCLRSVCAPLGHGCASVAL